MLPASELAREYNGWAKICVLLLTMEDDLDAINTKLDGVVKRLFYGSERGWLPVECIDEDGPGETGLRPDVPDPVPLAT